MFYRSSPLLTLVLLGVLGASLSSCSLFSSPPALEEAKKEEVLAPKEESLPPVSPVTDLPLPDLSLSPNPLLQTTSRPGLREPDVTTSLPLNLDGTSSQKKEETPAGNAPSGDKNGFAAPLQEAIPAIPPKTL